MGASDIRAWAGSGPRGGNGGLAREPRDVADLTQSGMRVVEFVAGTTGDASPPSHKVT